MNKLYRKSLLEAKKEVLLTTDDLLDVTNFHSINYKKFGLLKSRVEKALELVERAGIELKSEFTTNDGAIDLLNEVKSKTEEFTKGKDLRDVEVDLNSTQYALMFIATYLHALGLNIKNSSYNNREMLLNKKREAAEAVAEAVETELFKDVASMFNDAEESAEIAAEVAAEKARLEKEASKAARNLQLKQMDKNLKEALNELYKLSQLDVLASDIKFKTTIDSLFSNPESTEEFANKVATLANDMSKHVHSKSLGNKNIILKTLKTVLHKIKMFFATLFKDQNTTALYKAKYANETMHSIVAKKDAGKVEKVKLEAKAAAPSA